MSDSPRPKRPSKPSGDRKSFGDRPPRRDGDRPERGPRKSFGDRPPRRDGDRPDRGARKSVGDRQPRRDGDRPDRGPRKDFGDRPPRRAGDRPDRGPRKDFGDRPPRRDGDRPDRGPRKDFGDRPPRRDGDRPDRGPRKDFGDRSPRRDGDRPDRGPRKDFGDRPPRRDGDRPDRGPRKDFGDRPPRRDGDRPDRGPRKDFGDRPPRRDGDRPDRGPRRDHDRGRPFSAPKGEGMDPARRYAIGQILRVIHDNKPLKDQSGAFWDGLEPRDQAFAERLIKSTLRQYGQMAKLVRRCLTAPKLDDERLEPVLATAACELVLLDTPPYAVGSRYVDLVRDWNEGRYKGLVNAVIRRLAEQGKTWFEALGPEAALPRWLVKRWQKNWGVEETSQWWPMFQEQSAVDLVVSPQASVDDTYALGLTAEPLATGQLRLAKDAGRVRDLPGFEAGAFWVQDVAAYMPATLFGDVEGQQIWDMCAAPGGKTMQLAAKGAKVTAIDVDGSRLKRLRENLARVGLTANVVEADILRWKPVSKPDAILLDAPCSATGTLRHHPDAPWLRDADWVVSNVQLQADMIDKALDLLPVGGTLVYAVCSLEPEEGEQQVEGVMQRRDDVRFDPIDADSFAYAQCVRGPGWMRVFPSDVMPRGADGFFAARLVKTASGEGGGLEQWQAERADQTLAEDGAEEAQQPERARLSLKS